MRRTAQRGFTRLDEETLHLYLSTQNYNVNKICHENCLVRNPRSRDNCDDQVELSVERRRVSYYGFPENNKRAVGRKRRRSGAGSGRTTTGHDKNACPNCT